MKPTVHKLYNPDDTLSLVMVKPIEYDGTTDDLIFKITSIDRAMDQELLTYARLYKANIDWCARPKILYQNEQFHISRQTNDFADNSAAAA